MKRCKFFFLSVFILITGNFTLSAQTLSGNLDTKLTMGAGSSQDFFYGAEAYANIRLKIPVGEYAAVYSAFNLIAAAGTSAMPVQAASGTSLSGASSTEENFAAITELERLYIQLSGERMGLSAGLLRIPFGFGLVWRPVDFLNPQNPVESDARHRGVLGITASYFPQKIPDIKFLVFAAVPRDPQSISGEGARFGLSCDNHWLKASAQLLYCFESPASYTVYDQFNPPVVLLSDNYPLGLHRAGLSVKADLELGITAELLYTLNPDSPAGINGLAASAGMDYSFLEGKLYLLAEYLYSGSESVDAISAAMPSGHTGSHYLYAAGTWKWSDFSSFTLGCAANLEDISCTSIALWQYEFLHGMILSIKLHIPLDRDSFNSGDPGEFGPKNSGNSACFTAGLKLKF